MPDAPVSSLGISGSTSASPSLPHADAGRDANASRDGSARDARILTFVNAVDVALLRHVVHTCFLPPGPSTAAAIRRASALAARRLRKLVDRGELRAFPGPHGHTVYALAPDGGAGAEEPVPLLARARQARLAAALGRQHPRLCRDAAAYLHRVLRGRIEVIGPRACYAGNPERVGRKIPDGGLCWWPPGSAQPRTLWLEIARRPLCPTDVPRWRALTERFVAEHPADRILYVLPQGRPAHILELAADSPASRQLLAVLAEELLCPAPDPQAAIANGRGGVIVRPLLDALQDGLPSPASGAERAASSVSGPAPCRPGAAPDSTLEAALIAAVEDGLLHGLTLEEAASDVLAGWPYPATLPAVATILQAEFGIAPERMRTLARPFRPPLF